MEIIETSVFTRRVRELLRDDEYRLLQLYLLGRPDAGTVIRGSGGLRKLRWSVGFRGKRGGIRVVYYWRDNERLLMLYLYPKSERDDLTAAQKRALRDIVEKEYR